jgi:hypothetical protein
MRAISKMGVPPNPSFSAAQSCAYHHRADTRLRLGKVTSFLADE